MEIDSPEKNRCLDADIIRRYLKRESGIQLHFWPTFAIFRELLLAEKARSPCDKASK